MRRGWKSVQFRTEPERVKRIGVLARRLEMTSSDLFRHGLDLAITWAEDRLQAIELGEEEMRRRERKRAQLLEARGREIGEIVNGQGDE